MWKAGVWGHTESYAVIAKEKSILLSTVPGLRLPGLN